MEHDKYHDRIIEYIEMPQDIRNRCQYFANVDIARLYESRCKKETTFLEDAVRDYVRMIESEDL